MYTGITAPASDANIIKSEFQRKLEARRMSSLGKGYTIEYKAMHLPVDYKLTPKSSEGSQTYICVNALL